MTIIVTGSAGFIGYHVAERLFAEGCDVVGVDNFSAYYDVSIKEGRSEILRACDTFVEERMDLSDGQALIDLIGKYKPTQVIHLAAQPGVRYSLENPKAYTESNIDGFLSVLEACRHHPVKHFIFASTSSVYGANTAMPFSEHHGADHPVSLYAATKKANEMMAHSYAHIFGIPSTGLRFFTVYGPWGRPDMAPFLFTDAILNDRPIKVFNRGDMQRDFTYIDDIVEGIIRLIDKPPAPVPSKSESQDPAASAVAPYRILNIGSGRPEKLTHFIDVLERELGRKAKRELVDMQDGDVVATWCDTTEIEHITGFKPQINIDVGVARFVAWYLSYFGDKLQGQ